MKTRKLTEGDVFQIIYKNADGKTFSDIAGDLLDQDIAFTYQELGSMMKELVKRRELLLSDDGRYIPRLAI